MIAESLVFVLFFAVGVALVVLPWRIAAFVQAMSHLVWGGNDDWFLGRDGTRDFLHWYFRLFGIVWLLLLGFIVVGAFTA